jgi:hypothetical protein
MTNDELNGYLAKRVMGLVPCDGWRLINFGAAGGPALLKECEHENGRCYAVSPVGSIHGRVGGVPEYATEIRAMRELIKCLNDRGLTVEVQWKGLGTVSASVYPIEFCPFIQPVTTEAETAEEAVANAVYSFHQALTSHLGV